MASIGSVRGDHRQIGGDGEWANTHAIIGLNGRVFASHSNGKVFDIDPQSGRHTQVGSSSSWNTRLMFALGDWIALLEHSGTMWALDPSTGNHHQVGKDGEWTNITCGDWVTDSIYCFSKQGTLWDYSRQHGWRQLGNSANWKTKCMFADRGLVTIEEDHTMYRVDVGSGQATAIGRQQYDVRAGIGLQGHAYASFSDGHLWTLDFATGQWSTVGTSNGWRTRLMTTLGNDLVTLEENGTLYEIMVDSSQAHAHNPGYAQPQSYSEATEGSYAASDNSSGGITETAGDVVSEGVSTELGSDGEPREGGGRSDDTVRD